MDAADDESNPFAQSTFSWRTAFLFFLIALGGAYGLLLLAGRWSASFASLLPWPALGLSEGLELPLFAQLASLSAGLAALVLVLSRAVREVDTHPYRAIAPVLTVFAGLVHAGLRVDLSASGLSAPDVACAGLVVALLGGALIARQGTGPQLFGWMLVFAPSALVLLLMTLTKQPETALEPRERGYLVSLLASTLLLGVAGFVARRLRARARLSAGLVKQGAVQSGFDQDDAFADFLRAETEEPSYDPHGDPYDVRSPARGTFGAWLQTAVMLIAVAVVAYFVVVQLKRRDSASQTAAVPTMTTPVGPPVVEQLSETGKLAAREDTLAAPVPDRHEPSGRRGHGKTRGADADDSLASTPAPALLSRRAIRAQAKAARAEARRAAKNAASAAHSDPSNALPAWGSEARDSAREQNIDATHEFAQAKSERRPALKTAEPSTPAANEPAEMSAPKPQLAADPIVSTSKSTANAAEAAPAAPPAAPPPGKPLTLNQLLNRVEDAAHSQRAKKGNSSAPQSQLDSELDDLLNKAVHAKGK